MLQITEHNPSENFSNLPLTSVEKPSNPQTIKIGTNKKIDVENILKIIDEDKDFQNVKKRMEANKIGKSKKK